MSKSQNYPNGYLPKIEYWSNTLREALTYRKEVDMNEVERIGRKLNYFIQKEYDRKIKVKI